MTLTYEGIERVVPEGVQLKTGEIVPLDVLIFGTGFSLVRLRFATRRMRTATLTAAPVGHVTAAPSPGNLWRWWSSAWRLLEFEGWT